LSFNLVQIDLIMLCLSFSTKTTPLRTVVEKARWFAFSCYLHNRSNDMRNRKLSAVETIAALQAWQAGETLSQVCHQWSISAATLYRIQKAYAGLDVGTLARLEVLIRENARLRKRVRYLEIDSQLLQAALGAQGLCTHKRRELVIYLRRRFNVSLARVCRLVGLSRAMYHYQASPSRRPG
jgi:putative transposase